MKKTFLFLAVLAVTSLANAQPGRPGKPEDMAKRQTEMLSSKLNLTDAQKSQIYALTLAQAKTRDSIMTAARDNNQDRAAVMKSMRDRQVEATEKIKAILDDSQKAEYDKWLQERREGMRRGGGMRRQGGQNGE